MLSLDELTTPLTPEQARNAIYQVLAAVGVNTSGWKAGAVTRAIITAVATVFAAFTVLTSAVARSGFVELSAGDWLTLVARHVYGVERIPASFAVGNVTLSNAGGGVYSGDAGDLVVVNPTTGKAYRNTAAFVIGALQSGVVVPVQATEAGSASTSNPAAITLLETTLPGVTVTNAAALVGADDETDAALRARCLAKTESLSPNGPRDAYAYFARSAVRADGTAIGVNRVRTTTNDTIGTVVVTCATPTGAVTGTAGNPATDLGAISEAIQLNAVPLGVAATVRSATPVTAAVTYEVWIYSTAGLTDAQVRTTISTALTAFFNARPIGGDNYDSGTGYVYGAAIRAAIIGARPEIFNAVVTVPATDIELDGIEVVQAGTITCTAVYQVAP